MDIVAWGPLAERVSQYLNKGSRCLVQGRLQSRSWEQEGQKRSKVEVLANDVTFLDSKGSSSSNGGDVVYDEPQSKPSSKKSAKQDEVIEDIGDEPINLDEIPF